MRGPRGRGFPRPEPQAGPWALRARRLSLQPAGMTADPRASPVAPAFQYSCLENPMDGGVRRAIVRGAAKSRT